MSSVANVQETPETAMPKRLGEAGASGIPFGRLVGVELRKLTDTRAGRVLLVVTVVLVLGIGLIGVFSGKATEGKDLRDFIGLATVPLQILLPLVGILAVTAEWSQRTGLVTFTLEPRRTRVALSKWTAALLLGLAGVVLALIVAVAFTGLAEAARGTHPAWDPSWQVYLGTFAGQLFGMSMGVAFGMLIQNTAGAIVTYLVLPTLWSILGSFSWAENVAKWLDTNRTFAPLYDGSMHGDDWAKLGTSLVLWLVLPMIVGIWRMTHSEVKSA